MSVRNKGDCKEDERRIGKMEREKRGGKERRERRIEWESGKG
jgi:hypothetical protein